MSKSKQSVVKRNLDVICLGRAAVDFYGQQIGSRLEDVSSFAKYLGGSSCNIAYGSARLGLRSAMLTRVGDEHMGRFVREELSRVGVDVSHVVTDKKRLTGLVVLGIKDRETFPLIFYRTDCADMAISTDDFDEKFIASSKSLLITGTHFSTESTCKTSMQAIEYAKSSGTKVIVDIDYRPVLWGLTSLGDGETRFISSSTVSKHLQTIWPHCDLIVGTEEEIHIAGGSTDTLEALRTIRKLTSATIVLKLGQLGCTVLRGEIPNSMDNLEMHQGVQIDVLNVLGAGDGFMAGFLSGWLKDQDDATCASFANACGALTVSRHGCAPAFPSKVELDYYINNAQNIPHPDQDDQLYYLHRVTTQRGERQWSEVLGLAFDHRIQLTDMANEVGADISRIKQLKHLLVQACKKGAKAQNLKNNIGVLLDDTFGQDALNDITGLGWWIARPVEIPKSVPVEFEGRGSIGDRLRTWPLEHIVKFLIYYHPDHPDEIKQAQDQKVVQLYHACINSGHELLLEIIPPKEMANDEDTIVRALASLYDLGIHPDWWKLQGTSRATWQKLSDLIEARSPYCRGVVVLGLEAPIKELKKEFAIASEFDICKGFTVGRSLWAKPARQWLAGNLEDDIFVEQVANNYIELIKCWRSCRK